MFRGVAFVLLGAMVVGLFGCGGGSAPTTPTPTASTPPASPPPTSAPAPGPTAFTGWDYNGQAWQPMGTPPSCPSPLVLPLPVDISRVSSILYPGQVRGSYKPHGGFRFDAAGQTNAVVVTAPMDAAVVRGARYVEGGEVQYLFDFIHSCGVMYRFDHLLTLSPRFQALADALPAATEETRTTVISGQNVAAGDTIATAVGHRSPLNVGLDWGVYDLRQRNAASADPVWLASHPGEQAPYGVCWLDLLPAADAARVRALPPGDGQAGRTSDYCR